MRKIFLIIITLFIIASCRNYRGQSYKTSFKKYDENELIGRYKGVESSKVLIVSADSIFTILPPKYSYFEQVNMLDTISFGKWYADESFITITSSDRISRQGLPIYVEEFQRLNKDSIYFEIQNPYESLAEELEWKDSRMFYYNLLLNSNNLGFDARISSEKIENKLIVYRAKDVKIDSFSLVIYPDSYEYPGNTFYEELYTNFYNVKNPASNYFILKIPDFTYKYFHYDRFKNDYIRILNKKTLKWDGELFKKK